VATDDRVATQFRLPAEMRERLEREAARRDVSINWLITRAVERALPAWEEQEL
jgi:hypothetical protein